MTNYRISVCEYHDKPQFNFCFDCGSPLKFEPKGDHTDFDSLTCSRNWVHCRIFLQEHEGNPENTDCEDKEIES
jgi:hypothetical protein